MDTCTDSKARVFETADMMQAPCPLLAEPRFVLDCTKRHGDSELCPRKRVSWIGRGRSSLFLLLSLYHALLDGACIVRMYWSVSLVYVRCCELPPCACSFHALRTRSMKRRPIQPSIHSKTSRSACHLPVARSIR